MIGWLQDASFLPVAGKAQRKSFVCKIYGASREEHRKLMAAGLGVAVGKE